MNQFPLSRRKFLTLSAAALAGGALPAPGRSCPVLVDGPDPMKAQKAAAAATNAFAIDLYRQLAGKDSKEKGDLFLSPFSIETALAMTSAGARGKTLEEMEKVLHLPNEPHAGFGGLINRINGPLDAIEPKAFPIYGPQPKGIKPKPGNHRGYELSVANAIWAQKGFPWEKAFFDLTRKHYGAGLVEVNFAESEAARKQINEWVEKETQQKIKELIGPNVITALTRMVLANAVYFKSNWLYQFDKKKTTDAPFTRDDGTKADVPLMSITGKFNYAETHVGGRTGAAVQVLELPYAGKELSMLVFLPEKGRSVDLLAPRLDAQTLSAPALKQVEVKVFLPRFRAESALSLKPVLMDMGMKLAFGGADFTGMSPKGKELYITHVLHKAFVDVNEEGTEAAAATAVVIGRTAAPRQTVFRADRPFVFAIRDNATNATLFMGRYSGPK